MFTPNRHLKIASLVFVLLLLQSVTCFVNLSFNKKANMSSSQYSDKWLADEAVDGDVSQKVEQNSCAVTKSYEKQAWWRVDLGAVYVLNSVTIYYRKESSGSLTFRLSGFSIYLADTLNWWIGTRCYLHNNGQHANPGPSDIFTVPCNATGRYVTLYKQRNVSCFQTGNLSWENLCAKFEICEVQVLGCENGTYGKSCSNNCSGNCLHGAHCNKAHGGCDDGCAPGYRGFYCNEDCENGEFGLNCSYGCRNCNRYSCNRIDGSCPTGCAPGWQGMFCKEKCITGTFGSNCSNACGKCINSTCNHINGTCPKGCSPGWKGLYCNETCSYGFYGQHCSRTCKTCTETCHHVTGRCFIYETETLEDNTNKVIVGISVTSVILIIAFSITLLVTCLRFRNPPSTQKNVVNTVQQEQRQIHMSSIDDNSQNARDVMGQETVTEARSRATYETVMSTTNDANTYETLQPDRAITYTNTQLV